MRRAWLDFRTPPPFLAMLGLVVASSLAAGPAAGDASPAPRFTGETPDATVDALAARATAAKASETAQIASASAIVQLANRAAHGRAPRALDAIARGTAGSVETRGEAAVLARMTSDDEGTTRGVAAARALGLLTDVAVLGPIRDTGGGLEAAIGPEAKGAAGFADTQALYSWGTVEVGWRAVPPTFAGARGVPLDLLVHPRRESCTFVASRIEVPSARRLVVRLASTGQARLLFDGAPLATSGEAHEKALFDRLAARVDAAAGSHVVAAKVCSGALEDAGRVRLRLTDEAGAPLVLAASADLAAFKPGAAPRAEVLTTALARTIAPKPASGGALLDAAITRTLGGADDLASPRAPGQLDAFLQQKEENADALAMAAWVTPSGANRSARLERARRLAEKTGDAKTLAFVERRLVEHHVDTEMPDWAMATLRGMKAPDDADMAYLRTRVKSALRIDALRVAALAEARAWFERAPKDAPTALLFEGYKLAQAHDVKLWMRLADELASRGVRGDVLVAAKASVDKDAVVAAARDAFEGGMDDADEAISVAGRVFSAGATDVASELFRRTCRLAPNRPEAWASLAHVLAASPDAEAKKLVLVALRRARELAPGDARARSELVYRLRRGHENETASRETGDDERHLTPTEKILARRGGVPRSGAPDVEDRQLHWLRVVRMHPDNRVSQLIQYAREIVIAPRTQQELYEPIPPEGDLTEILTARVHKKNGVVAFPSEEHNDGARPRIRWADLEAGDTVEVVIRQWTSTAVGGRGDAPFSFSDYAGGPASHPLLFNQVVIETTPDHPLYVDVLHPELAPFEKSERDERGVHVLSLTWQKPPVIPEEPLAPNLSETAPMVVGSTFRTWADFRKWYAGAIRGFTEPDEEVRRLAAELTKGKRTQQEKLRALFEFVADDIRYVNYVSGEWWLPNRPQQLLARREGDCDDKAILLITLLRSVGIEAQEVMVQTRLTAQPSVLLAKNVAVPLFDHGIAFLPGPGGGMYLDATSPESRLGPLPSMDARAVALRMDAGPAEIVRLPASSPDDHGADVSWSLTLGDDGSGSLEGEETHVGDAAFYLRTNLSQAEARSQYVEDALVGPWMSAVDVDKNIEFKGDLAGGKAFVRYRATSKNLARREGRELVLSLSPSATLGSTLAPLEKRTLPIVLPSYLAPSHQTRALRVVAPRGYAWADLPPGGEVDGKDLGRARLELARDPKDARVLRIKRTLVFDQHVVPVDRYPAFRSFLLAVDALMHKDVRLVEAR